MHPIDKLTLRQLGDMQKRVRIVKQTMLRPDALCDMMIQSYMPEAEDLTKRWQMFATRLSDHTLQAIRD